MELNPNHPVTEATRDMWYKLLVIYMVKNKHQQVVITAKDVADVAAKTEGLNIVVQELEDGIHLTLVDDNIASLVARVTS